MYPSAGDETFGSEPILMVRLTYDWFPFYGGTFVTCLVCVFVIGHVALDHSLRHVMTEESADNFLTIMGTDYTESGSTLPMWIEATQTGGVFELLQPRIYQFSS